MQSPNLSSHAAPDVPMLWRSLRELVTRVGHALEGDAVIDDCLDLVVDLLGADRGVVLIEQADGTTAIVHARSPRKRLTPGEQEEVSRTIVRRALESDAAVVWNRTNDPVDSSSVTLLDIHAALVAPLRGRGMPRGVLYVDFRHPLKHVQPAHQDFFLAAVVLIGAMLDQSAASRSFRERLIEAQSHFTEARETPALEELLRPRSMARVRDAALLALGGTAPILLTGESGCGKTLIAQALAEASDRRPIVRIVLGGSDDVNTIASELFGHERGAFSGATGKRVGLVEYADGGTIVFDEILNLPGHAQKLLLDFTQFGTYRPLGFDKAQPKRADVRIIAATNGDLRAAMREGRFREDLYYRIAGVTLELPPLRERRAEIPALAETIVRRADPRPVSLSLEVRKHLAGSAHGWPGNLRELEWVVRRARDRAFARGATATEIRMADLVDWNDHSGPPSAISLAPEAKGTPAEQWRALQDLKAKVEAREAELLRAALDRHDGVVAHAARELGVARTTLAGRVHALHVDVKKG